MQSLLTLLGLGFIGAGAGKLGNQHGYHRLFRRWGWSTREMRLVGAAEIVGGLLVATPPTRKLGGTILTAVSATVLAAELRHGDGELGGARAMLLLAALGSFLPYRQAWGSATTKRPAA